MQMSDWTMLQTLYECRNLTRAAELLYLSQPTLTRRLQCLEKELGVSIAIRSKRGIVFTPEGEYLAVKAAQIQSIMQEVRTHLAQTEKEPERTLSIGASNSMTRFCLPALLQKYQMSHPHVHFSITTGMSKQISRMVEQGKLDLGFVNGDFPFSGQKTLFRVEQGYLASSQRLALSQLPGQPYITYFKDPSTQFLIEQWWSETFSAPFPQGLTVKDGDICKSMIARGLGYSFFFTHEYLEEYPDFIQLLYHSDGTPLTRNAWVLHMPKVLSRPEVQEFLELCDPNGGGDPL